MARSKFSTRAFVTTLLVWSFATLVVSGLVLYIAPPGRVAHWSGWTLLGLSKSGWQALHTLTGLLFLVGGLFHLLKFNWGVFRAYVRRSREAASPFLWPLLAGTAVFALTVAGTVADVPPFGTVMTLGERASQAWATPDREPPVPHMELETLERLAAGRGVPVAVLTEALERAGFTAIREGADLREIARANGTTPRTLWKALEPVLRTPERAPVAESRPGRGGGRGLGRLTVEEAAGRLGITAERAVANLRRAGVEADPGDTLRDLASSLGWTPAELVHAMEDEG